MTFYADSHPTARKEHRCHMCARTIRPGETYRRGFGADGNAWTWKECAHCDALMRYVQIARDLDEYDTDAIPDWDPATVNEYRIKANWARQWTRRDGTLVPAPTLTIREDKYGFGRVVAISSEPPTPKGEPA